jgi:hypothetical protein
MWERLEGVFSILLATEFPEKKNWLSLVSAVNPAI